MKVVQLPEPTEPKHSCAKPLRSFYATEEHDGRKLPVGCTVACICGRRWKLIAGGPIAQSVANSMRKDTAWYDNPIPGLLWDYAGHVLADWDDVKDVREEAADVPS